jgi:hypothetical protein
MTTVRNLLICLSLLLLPSCSLIGGLVKLPFNILKGVGGLAGLGLSDAPAQPVTDEQEKQRIYSIGYDPVPAETSAE